jgi:LmbE family N-acetylglucosaminyl deacetylase
VSQPLPLPARALAIGAHPDDIEFGCGATLARWARQGTETHLLVLTDGSKGTWDHDEDLSALVGTRQEEARAAAACLGNGTVHFGGYVDGELVDDESTRRTVCRTIRSVRPDVVITHDPWKRYRLHPDHRHAGFATIGGLVAARDPHFFPDEGSHHRPTTLLLFEADEVNHEEYATNADLGTKVAALLCHRSQWRTTMGIDADAPEADEMRAAFGRRIRGRARGTQHGASLAERFHLIADL